jgi:hypothetical protein
MRIFRVAGICGSIAALGLILEPTVARAQYASDFAAESNPNAIRYFGFAKDVGGRRIADVTVLLKKGPSTYIFITDKTGRFRGELPQSFAMASVKPTCVKAGFQMVRADKRPGVGTRTVQVDCAMRPAVTGGPPRASR